jgi:uncharacterized membrane protein YqjE
MSQPTMPDTANDGSRPTEPRRPEQSLGELIGDMTRDVSTLLRKEIELAKVEAREEATRLGRGAGMLAGAGLAAWLALLFLSLGLAWLLDQAMNTALAFAIVGVIWAVIGAVLLGKGKKDIKSVEALPKTVTTLKEDVQWAKQQKS